MTTTPAPPVVKIQPGYALPEGGFKIAIVDPPWTFKTFSAKGMSRSAEHHYPCLDNEAIKALPVGSVLAKDSVVLLWVTNPQMEFGFQVLRAWGFAPSTVFLTWTKLDAHGSPQMGTGYSTRSCTEHVLLGRRGAGVERVGRAAPSAILAPVREHSRKPDELYATVDHVYGPDAPRIELFARRRWDARTYPVGDEVDGQDVRDELPALARRLFPEAPEAARRTQRTRKARSARSLLQLPLPGLSGLLDPELVRTSADSPVAE
ncbi:MAG TPA: MT-A70 family methyltransferase [Actinomycetota bacterium]|nr:MT-A70 family methyltransferase [Actinomycetota bacterium]